ncbi:uncharacterized protein LOC143287298 [Babylonia areolata]|uniref:uncharacterized protein LOC143287298 n=1 Tax=Babylonia areolata TaxID=304850 RepID=UPI003FD5A17C
MEIQVVHTTGSPSRHESDSESSYDKNLQLKSSSEMALHRKQSRRTKKQMSERQRRKRMNTSMDKLGLLVYGKTFKDGLKVDKATLLKDAYEKLQMMKDDYHKGYETAISSTQSFLDNLQGCPQEVKVALTRHLHATLQRNLHRCQSTTSDTPHEDRHSDSCSPPLPTRSASPEISEDGLHAHFAPSQLSPSKFQPVYTSASVPEERAEYGESVCFGSRPAGASSRPRPSDAKPSASTALAEVRASSSRPVGTPSFRAVAEAVVPMPAYIRSEAAGRYFNEVDDVSSKARSSSPSVSVPPCSQTTPSSSSFRAHSSWGMTPDLRCADAQDRPLCAPCPAHTPYPFTHLYSTSSSSPLTSAPKISPYVTPFAPQDPLYLGSTPAALLCRLPAGSNPSGLPEPSLSVSQLGSSHPHHPSLHPLSAHTPAHYAGRPRYGGTSRAADDSGYMSPVVPSPHTTPLSVAPYGGVKKRYLREMGQGGGRGAREDTDEENDKEVERVFSRRSIKYDSDSGSALSE